MSVVWASSFFAASARDRPALAAGEPSAPGASFGCRIESDVSIITATRDGRNACFCVRSDGLRAITNNPASKLNRKAVSQSFQPADRSRVSRT